MSLARVGRTGNAWRLASDTRSVDDMTDENESVYDAADATDPANAAAAQNLVTNDAVAGEPVLDDDDAVRLPREAAPTSDESVPANDGYTHPRHGVSEEVDLGPDDGQDSPVTTTWTEPQQ